MRCPHCGVWTRVLETRTREDGTRRRSYECANLHKFNTVERVETAPHGGARQSREAKRAVQAA
jgi:transcriptional regulator NrdR family protein